ncbi:serine hydrolase domain-containing protein [Actinoplanes sp. NPDC051494]|uniref:serine hydrolase domain-containing protein n=1 Tax=Actinoplanes sp. NPDC051494 TaxID=3363907 RepID=UPI0037AA4291
MSVSLSRRALLSATAGGAAAAAIWSGPAEAGLPPAVHDLERKIRVGMQRYGIPGVALGLRYRGVDYVRGFGVTDVTDPVPVDGDTVFRVASTTKTFTGTAVMRLVERGRLDLDRTVRSYLPDFRTADAGASARVTVRQALNHSAGWLGDYFLDTGRDDDALKRYVAGMAGLPQLTAPGSVFAYNNAAISLAGRLVEVVTGMPYERAVRLLVLDPLRLTRSGFFLDEIPGASRAVPHVPGPDGALMPLPELWDMPRGVHPAGGLISSARDQLRWARFHLGDGGRLLTRRSMRAMQSRPGPGGTLFVELDGAGVTWMLRPTAEGPRVVQHGGDWPGQHSGFLIVPERDFALTVLTNSVGGPALTAELFAGDGALRRFAGVRNLPAVVRGLRPSELAGYEGGYTAEQVGPDGATVAVTLELVAAGGGLSVRSGGVEGLRLAFYRRDHVLIRQPDGTDTHFRGNFVRGSDGTVAWLRYGGRLYRRGAAPATPRTMSRATTFPYPMI